MIYPYLTRLADKGLIELDDIVQPITQTQILDALRKLKKIQLH